MHKPSPVPVPPEPDRLTLELRAHNRRLEAVVGLTAATTRLNEALCAVDLVTQAVQAASEALEPVDSGDVLAEGLVLIHSHALRLRCRALKRKLALLLVNLPEDPAHVV